MKPIQVKRKNKSIGGKVRVWTGGKPRYALGTIVNEKGKCTFKWNYSEYSKSYQSTFLEVGYMIELDNYKDMEDNHILPFREFHITFLDKIIIEKPRKCPDLKALVNNLEVHEIELLSNLLKDRIH